MILLQLLLFNQDCCNQRVPDWARKHICMISQKHLFVLSGVPHTLPWFQYHHISLVICRIVSALFHLIGYDEATL